MLKPLRAFLVCAFAALVCAPATLADNPSANWAGYAVLNNTFQSISAHWRQPRAICTRGKKTYSAMWVGIGGYSLTSTAVDQVGTELNCGTSGRVGSSAWYEAIPWPSHTIGLRIQPGDQIAASVRIVGSSVVVSLNDLTSHRSFRKTLHPPALDNTSAEWILEAPSACLVGTNSCQIQPLTDFGQALFWQARAQDTGGQRGTISQGPWTHTKLSLVPGGQQFISQQSGSSAAGSALPSALNGYGGSFKVTYRSVNVASGTTMATRLPSGRTYLRH